MALFFRKMNMINTNKFQHFLVVSLIFHLLLFLTWSSLAVIKKNSQELEVFIISNETKLPREISKNQAPVVNTIKREKIFQETKKLEVQTDKKVAVETTKVENTATFQTSQSSSDKNILSGSKEGRAEKIIDTEFGSLHGPKFIHREIPVYPQIARRLGKEGKVVLRLTINEKGELINVEVIENAPYGFTESALEAVKKSKFYPATKDGKPIACRAILPIRFVLKN